MSLTWRTLSLAARSKTRSVSWSGRRWACRSWWADDHPPPHPPTRRTSRSGSGRHRRTCSSRRARPIPVPWCLVSPDNKSKYYEYCKTVSILVLIFDTFVNWYFTNTINGYENACIYGTRSTMYMYVWSKPVLILYFKNLLFLLLVDFKLLNLAKQLLPLAMF